MANPALMTALGTIGAGLSQYGRTQREREALAREQEALDYTRNRQGMLDRLMQEDRNRQIEESNLARTRQTERDVLDAILGGLRPSGQMGPLKIGGRAFDMPEVLTKEEQIQARARRFKTAYPYISNAQADLLARAEMDPGEVIIDPGTRRQPKPQVTFDPFNPMANVGTPKKFSDILFGGIGR